MWCKLADIQFGNMGYPSKSHRKIMDTYVCKCRQCVRLMLWMKTNLPNPQNKITIKFKIIKFKITIKKVPRIRYGKHHMLVPSILAGMISCILTWNYFELSKIQCSGGGSHPEQGAIQVVRTHLYVEKLHSYGVTVKLGVLASTFPLPMKHLSCYKRYRPSWLL